MAFLELDRGAARRPKLTNTTSIFVHKAVVNITISGDVFAQLGRPPFFKIALGTGQDSGFVSLRPAFVKSKQTYTSYALQNGARITVSANRLGIAGDLRTTHVPFVIEPSGAVIVDLRGIRPVVTTISTGRDHPATAIAAE